MSNQETRPSEAERMESIRKGGEVFEKLSREGAFKNINPDEQVWIHPPTGLYEFGRGLIGCRKLRERLAEHFGIPSKEVYMTKCYTIAVGGWLPQTPPTIPLGNTDHRARIQRTLENPSSENSTSS